MCMLVGWSLFSTPVWSQAVEGGARSAPISSIASVAIGSLSDLSPAQPLLNVTTSLDEWCTGPRCFRGVLTVRANHRWQLQARLDPGRALAGPVIWHPPLAGSVEVPLSPSTWTTIQAGGMPTGGLEVVLRFSVTASEKAVDATTISAALQYRVVPLP